MCSFDIQNMYTNIPNSDVISIINNILKTNPEILTKQKDIIHILWGFFKKFCSTFLFLRIYLFKMVDTWWQYKWTLLLHTLFFYSFHKLVWPYASVEQVHVFLAGTSSSCLRSHFLTASITLLSSSKWVPQKASLRDPKRRKSTEPDLGCRVDGAASSNPFWWCVPGFSGLCEGVQCHAGAIFLNNWIHTSSAYREL
jgi:hypothetical protein